jgi:hypothetical protein
MRVGVKTCSDPYMLQRSAYPSKFKGTLFFLALLFMHLLLLIFFFWNLVVAVAASSWFE